MPAATFTLFDEFGSEIGLEGHQLETDTLSLYLTNSSVAQATDTTSAAHTIISTNGGEAKTFAGTQTWTETGAGSGIWRLALTADQTWTATGAGFTFRYIVLSNTTASDKLVGYWDYGSSQAVAAGETVTLDLDANYGVFTITIS